MLPAKWTKSMQDALGPNAKLFRYSNLTGWRILIQRFFQHTHETYPNPEPKITEFLRFGGFVQKCHFSILTTNSAVTTTAFVKTSSSPTFFRSISRGFSITQRLVGVFNRFARAKESFFRKSQGSFRENGGFQPLRWGSRKNNQSH